MAQPLPAGNANQGDCGGTTDTLGLVSGAGNPNVIPALCGTLTGQHGM